MEELAELAGISRQTMNRKINQFNKAGLTLNYRKKDNLKITDEFLIDLVNKNPDLSMGNLARLTNVSTETISNRIKKLNGNGKLNYSIKDNLKLSDELLIDLVDNNPTLTTDELGKLAGVRGSTICARIKQMNSNGVRVNYVNKRHMPDECSMANLKLTYEFLNDLINNNPDLNMEELAELAGVSRKTMDVKIKQFNKSGLTLNYYKKDTKKLTDEFLIDLVNKNPDLSMENLAKLGGVSITVISSRIKKFNGDGSLNYSIKDNLKFSDELLVDLINKNPTLTTSELGKLAGVHGSTICTRIKQMNSNGVRVNYVKKKHIPDGYNMPNLKITYEFLNDLINNNPDLNMEELAELAGISRTTMHRKIKQFNKAGLTLNYCKKDTKKLTDEFLIDLVNDNPDLSLEELARLGGFSSSSISSRINKLSGEGRLNYKIKDNSKLSDEILIDLVNKNPTLTTGELGKLAGVCGSTICARIKQMNSNGIRVDYAKKKYIPQRYNRSGDKLTYEFLDNMINCNPSLNVTELVELAGVSRTTMHRNIKQFNKAGLTLNYCKKDTKKLTDEFLIDLINKNPDLSMENLSKLGGVSVSTISNRIKKINRNEIRVNYTYKDSKLTDEFITNLVNENPKLSTCELAELASVSVKTISSRIRKINSNGVVANYTSKVKSKKS
jgi:DeoR/GlpR family transcriptional regulator of sugar metabolism